MRRRRTAEAIVTDLDAALATVSRARLEHQRLERQDALRREKGEPRYPDDLRMARQALRAAERAFIVIQREYLEAFGVPSFKRNGHNRHQGAA